MTTLMSHSPQGLSLTDLARPRLRQLFSAVLDIFADAQKHARAAHELYPFAE